MHAVCSVASKVDYFYYQYKLSNMPLEFLFVRREVWEVCEEGGVGGGRREIREEGGVGRGVGGGRCGRREERDKGGGRCGKRCGRREVCYEGCGRREIWKEGKWGTHSSSTS